MRPPNRRPLQRDSRLEVLKVHQEAGARRRLQVDAPQAGHPRGLHHRARRRFPHRQAHGGHHRERGRILQRKSCPRSRPGHEGSRFPRLLGRQQGSLRLQQAHGAGRSQEAALPRTRSGHRAVVERIFGMAESGRGILDITRTLNDEGIANPTGRLWSKNRIHIILRNEAYTGALVWGTTAKDKAEPGAGGEGVPRRRLQGPVQKGEPEAALPSGATPAGWGVPTSSADWSGARRATAPSPARTPRAGSSPTTSASPSSSGAVAPATPPGSTPAASRGRWWARFGRTCSPSPTSGRW